MLASVWTGTKTTPSGNTTPHKKIAFLQSLTASRLSGSVGCHGHSSTPGGVVKAYSVQTCIATVCKRQTECCVALVHILWLLHSPFLNAPRPLRHWPPEGFVLETFALLWSARSFETMVSGGRMVSRTVLGRDELLTSWQHAFFSIHSLHLPEGLHQRPWR